jgi:hypothetical protein
MLKMAGVKISSLETGREKHLVYLGSNEVIMFERILNISGDCVTS